jgi:ParB-like nuclease family protein
MNRKVERQLSSSSPEHSLKASLSLKIVYCRIDALKPDPANPRRHTKKQIRQIADSIKTFDFNVPILIDGEGNIVAGHGRFFACRLLGITEVPTLCLNHLTPEQARAFRIADNRLTEISIWDDRLLAEQLKDLSLHGLDFTLEATGFEMGEIDLRIASLEEPLQRDDDPADVVPEVSAGPALSKIGDLWVLDRHRVLCGSALEYPAFAALMGEEPAAMVFVDPPYNAAPTDCPPRCNGRRNWLPGTATRCCGCARTGRAAHCCGAPGGRA